MRTWCGIAALLLAIPVAGGPLRAQNLIVQDGWQGFAVRGADGKFDRCVLYNRTIEALNASPYDMLGVTRDASGNLGLMVFFQPRALERARAVPVGLKLDERAAVTVTGDVVSDFHVVIPGPVPPATTSVLPQASTLEVTVEDKSARFTLAGIGGVLDRLTACVTTYAR